MSKLSFRARALDAGKPMPIYMAEELPDLPDYSAINRAVPQMPSGMEKEEECEHHLQRAICAGLIIPTPEVSEVPDKDAYNKMYPANYKQPRQLIHMQPFTMEQDIPDYDMDSEDERWLEMQAKKLDLSPLKFEEMMDRLEKSSGQTVVTLQEAKALLKEDDDLIIAVFDYWLNKRLKLQHPLILAVKTEQRIGTAVNNPYLAFRRRTEKMQTRKNRKNDETSYEKMLKLRRDLSRAVTLLEFVKRREKMKREYLHLTVEVFEKRFQARDFAGAVAAEVLAHKSSAASAANRPAFQPIFHNHYAGSGWPNKAILKDEVIPRKEKRQYKKRKHKSLGHGRMGGVSGAAVDGVTAAASSDDEPSHHTGDCDEVDDEGQFAFRRNKLCSYHMPLPSEGNWPWCSKQDSGLADVRYRYSMTSLLHPARRCVGLARRRLGRGGRVILDRLTRDSFLEDEGDDSDGGGEDFWSRMDYTVYDSAAASAPRTDVKCGGQMGAASGHQRTGFNNVSGDGGSVCVKVEPVDVEEKGVVRDKEVPGAVRKDWLHFRPKTPLPPDFPPPHLDAPPESPPFSEHVPFSLELRSLEDSSDVFAEASVFSTAPQLYPELDVPITDTRQLVSDGGYSTDSDSDGGVVGCSRFSVSDSVTRARTKGTAAAPPPPLLTSVSVVREDRAPGLKRQRVVGRATTDRQESRREGGGADGRVRVCGTETNGIVSQFTVDGGNNRVGIGGARTTTNKISFGFTRTIGGGPTTNTNNVSSVPNTASGTLSLRTSTHPVTLNSHSANNILEIPLTDVDMIDDSSSEQPSSKSVTVEPDRRLDDNGKPSTTTKAIVRKNNLAMEVT